jgi:hypothetical protein
MVWRTAHRFINRESTPDVEKPVFLAKKSLVVLRNN